MVSDQKELHMIVRSRYLPKESTYDVGAKPKGEDAHLFCKSRQAIIVCDGVGAWAEKGIDSGIYARNLARNTAAACKKQPKHEVNLKDALLEAHANTTAEGSSTACAIALTGGNRLRFANVGDSGFLVFRGGVGLVYESPKRQHSFNRPYQLVKGETNVSWLVNEGEFEVEAGDIVLAGTDGLFDNMFVSEMVNILARETRTEELARKIASKALSNSKNEFYESPFQKEAVRQQRWHYGGKYDDITVVVAKIAKKRWNPPRWWKRLKLNLLESGFSAGNYVH